MLNSLRARNIVFILCALLLSACTRFFGPPPVPAQADTATPPPTVTFPPVVLPPASHRATVSEIINTVEAKPFPEAPFEPVVDGALVSGGGQVRTGADSHARIDLSEGVIIRLGADTIFTIQAFAGESPGEAELVGLDFGKIWVSLFGGAVQVQTPVGAASVRGSFAIFEYRPGLPGDPTDDILIVDCIEGLCTAPTAAGDEQLGTLERITVTNAGTQVTRTLLTDADVQNFIIANPDVGEALRATLTAVAVPIQPDSATPTDTSAPPTPGATGTPILGKHIVRSGETLFCIGRAYGILPGAIAEANSLDLNASIFPNQELLIPAVRWVNIPAGPVCTRQFNSPFPGGVTPAAPPPLPPIIIFPTVEEPTATLLPTDVPTITLTPTPVCKPPSFYDPAMDRCRVLETPTEPPTPTDTPVP